MRYRLIVTIVIALALGASIFATTATFGNADSIPAQVSDNVTPPTPFREVSDEKITGTTSPAPAAAPVVEPSPISAPAPQAVAPVQSSVSAPAAPAPAPIAPAAPTCHMVDTPIPGYQMCATEIDPNDIQIISEPTAPQYETLFR